MLWQLKTGEWLGDSEVLKSQTLFKNKSRAMQEAFRKVKEMKQDGTPLIQVANGLNGHLMWQTRYSNYWDNDVFIELRPLVKTERRKRLNGKAEHTEKYESRNTNYIMGIDQWR
jgi:hypothetical protein